MDVCIPIRAANKHKTAPPPRHGAARPGRRTAAGRPDGRPAGWRFLLSHPELSAAHRGERRCRMSRSRFGPNHAQQVSLAAVLFPERRIQRYVSPSSSLFPFTFGPPGNAFCRHELLMSAAAVAAGVGRSVLSQKIRGSLRLLGLFYFQLIVNLSRRSNAASRQEEDEEERERDSFSSRSLTSR